MKVTGTDGKEYTIEPGANLTGDNLSGADLSYADLRGTILKSQKTKIEPLNGDGWEIPKITQT